MEKKKISKVILIIIGVFVMICLIPLVSLFVLFCVIEYVPPLTYEEMEQKDKEMRPKSGIIFPEDTLFIKTSDDRLGEHWYYTYTSKEPLQLPENLNKLRAKSIENQDYWLKIGNYLWVSDKPFEIPVDLEEVASNWCEDKESFVSLVEDLKKKGEKWETECDFDRYEKMFSSLFETSISGATDYWEANWITNKIAFKAQMLKTPEKSYLYLYTRDVKPSDLVKKIDHEKIYRDVVESENVTQEELQDAQKTLKDVLIKEANAGSVCDTAYSLVVMLGEKAPVDFAFELLDEADKLLNENIDKTTYNELRKKPITDYYRAIIYYTIGDNKKGDEYAEKARPKLEESDLEFLQNLRGNAIQNFQ